MRIQEGHTWMSLRILQEVLLVARSVVAPEDMLELRLLSQVVHWPS